MNLLITDVSVRQIHTSNGAEFCRYIHDRDLSLFLKAMAVDRRPEFEQESIQIERFSESDGTEHLIGMTAKVKEALRIPLGAAQSAINESVELRKSLDRLDKQFKKKQNELDSACQQLTNLKKLKSRLESISFFDRIKIMFGANPLEL